MQQDAVSYGVRVQFAGIAQHIINGPVFLSLAGQAGEPVAGFARRAAQAQEPTNQKEYGRESERIKPSSSKPSGLADRGRDCERKAG
jgi:hypothetical protein